IRARIDQSHTEQWSLSETTRTGVDQESVDLRNAASGQGALFVMDDGDGSSALTPVQGTFDDRRNQRLQWWKCHPIVEKRCLEGVHTRSSLAEQHHDLVDPVRRSRPLQLDDGAHESVAGRADVPLVF